MSYIDVIRHIQRILNNCGDPVILSPTGQSAMHDSGHISIEIKTVGILRQNNCCNLPIPSPLSVENPPNKFLINRIRISQSLADDYSKNFPYTDSEMQNLICSKQFLFGYYEE